MTADQHHDVAVVGLGLIGSGALRALADAGQRCVGVGPAEPADWSNHPGVFASHYDSGRITRHLDRVREWGVLAARSIAGYADLEARSGIAFHRPVGVVLAVPADEVCDHRGCRGACGRSLDLRARRRFRLRLPPLLPQRLDAAGGARPGRPHRSAADAPRQPGRRDRRGSHHRP